MVSGAAADTSATWCQWSVLIATDSRWRNRQVRDAVCSLHRLWPPVVAAAPPAAAVPLLPFVAAAAL